MSPQAGYRPARPGVDYCGFDMCGPPRASDGWGPKCAAIIDAGGDVVDALRSETSGVHKLVATPGEQIRCECGATVEPAEYIDDETGETGSGWVCESGFIFDS